MDSPPVPILVDAGPEPGNSSPSISDPGRAPLLPRTESLPMPVSMSSERGRFTPYFAGQPELAFHGNGISRDPFCLSFRNVEELMPGSEKGDVPVPGLSAGDRDETLWRFHEFSRQGLDQGMLFDAAQKACGLAVPNGRTPAGSYRVHVFDGFLCYAGAPEAGESPPCFLAVRDIAAPDLRGRVGSLFAPEQSVLLIAMFPAANWSHHILLEKTRAAQAWLGWLGAREGWGSLAPVRHLPPAPR